MKIDNETVKNWAKATYEVPKNASIQEICFSTAFIAAHEIAADLLDARELIKEMREQLCAVVSTASTSTTKGELVYINNYIEMRDILEKTKEYA